MLNLGNLKVRGSIRSLLILFTIYYSFFTGLNAASVKAMVDTVEVVKGNPVTLRLKAIGEDVVFPQIQKVADAVVVGSSKSRSSNLSITNGSMISQQSVTHIIQFTPQKDMTIPAYTVTIEGKEYHTDSIDIKVVKSEQNSELFSLKMSANKTKVIAGEPFVLTVYFSLKEGVRLSQDVQYTPPVLSDFVVANISEQSSHRKGSYQIQEIQYIVTPQKEGNFTIAPAQAKIGVADRSRRDIFGLSFATKWMQTNSNDLAIEVVSPSIESDLVGDFTVDISIDKKEIEANKPVNLKIRIEGKGNLEGYEFPKYEIDGVTVYSDEATIESKIVDASIYSIYTKSFAFIADTDFTIPLREISVYNPESSDKKTLKIPSFNIKVEGSKAVTSQAKVQTMVETKEPLEPEVIREKVEVLSVAWWMLAVAFVLGGLLMYIAQLAPKWFKRKEKRYKESEALKILYGHMSESKEVEEMVRKLYAKKNGDKSVKIDKKELKAMVERFR